MAIAWSPLMSVNIPEVDQQHQTLIQTVDQLGNMLQQQPDKAEVAKILDFAGHYALTHFQCEETYFDRFQCPDAATNKAEHEKFVTIFTGLMQKFQEKGTDLVFLLKLYQTLSEWLTQHILGVDIKLRAYVP